MRKKLSPVSRAPSRRAEPFLERPMAPTRWRLLEAGGDAWHLLTACQGLAQRLLHSGTPKVYTHLPLSPTPLPPPAHPQAVLICEPIPSQCELKKEVHWQVQDWGPAVCSPKSPRMPGSPPPPAPALTYCPPGQLGASFGNHLSL